VLSFTGSNQIEISADEVKYINLQKLLRSAIMKNTLQHVSLKKKKKHSEVTKLTGRKGQRFLKDITDFSLD